MAKKTVKNFVVRAIRLYEQEPGEASRLRPAWVVPATLGQVGSGGACLKVIRHLKNCKFTTLADAVERTRNLWPAEADAQRYHIGIELTILN